MSYQTSASSVQSDEQRTPTVAPEARSRKKVTEFVEFKADQAESTPIADDLGVTEDQMQVGDEEDPSQNATVSDAPQALEQPGGEAESVAPAEPQVQPTVESVVEAVLFASDEPLTAARLTSIVETTPKHGSWLDMAEIELGILGRQCPSRRIDNIDRLRRETKVWQATRNIAGAKVDWQFTTQDARIKLKKLYPSLYA